MNIIIEGPDGVGKSTLVEKLKQHYNIDSIRLSYKDPKDFNFYDRILEKTDCIFDRHFLSEIVYSKLFRRGCELSWDETVELFNKTQDLNIPIFILDTDKEEILKRFKMRPEKENQTIIDNISYLQTEFDILATMFGIEVIDTTKVSFNEIIRKVELKREKNRSYTLK